MAESTKTPVKIQVFPKQKLKDLPRDKDIELSVVPKQVIKMQGISGSSEIPKLTLTVDASGRSKLHYTPSNCASGDEACLEEPGVNEIWIPKLQHPIARFNVAGFSSPLKFGIPREMCDAGSSLKMVMGEFSAKPALPMNPVPSGGFAAGQIPEDVEDFYIALADNSRVLEKSGIKPGGGELSELSDLQKTMLRSLVKETVAAGGAILDENELIRDFGFKGKYYLKEKNGKKYVVFKGHAGLRKIFRGSQFNLAKDYSRLSILTIKEGAGQAAKQSLGSLKSLSKGSVIGFLFMGAVDTWVWMQEDGEDKFISDLIIEIGSDLAKSIFAGVAAAMIVGAIVASFLTAVPVIAVIAGTIAVGMAIGLTLDYLDEKAGFTASIKEGSKRVGPDLKTLWNELVDHPFERIFNRFVWEMKRGVLP